MTQVSVKFTPSSNNPFLNALGVPYGKIEIGDHQTGNILTSSILRNTIEAGIGQGLLAEADRPGLEEAGKDLLPDSEAVLARVREFKLPDEFAPMFVFELCNRCPREDRHGYIHLGGGVMVGPIDDVTQAFEKVQELFVRTGDPVQIIAVLQNILATPNLGGPKVASQDAAVVSQG